MEDVFAEVIRDRDALVHPRKVTCGVVVIAGTSIYVGEVIAYMHSPLNSVNLPRLLLRRYRRVSGRFRGDSMVMMLDSHVMLLRLASFTFLTENSRSSERS